MSLGKLTMIVAATIAVGGVVASLVIRHGAQMRLREKETVLRQQGNQLDRLAAEHQRLSNLLAEANRSATNALADDHTAELPKLRTEAETLRKQTNELAKQLAENRRAGKLSDAALPTAGSINIARYVVSDSNSEEYKEQLYRIASAAPHSLPLTNNRTMDDARHLSSAVGKYAREHQGEFPSSFDEAAPYFYEVQAQHYEQMRKLEPSLPPKQQESPLPSEFEMVYQGSLNEFTNIPDQAVALIRERQAWPTPSGKWARIYVMANGFVRIVESDDNFQSWEAEHIIPPPSAGQQ